MRAENLKTSGFALSSKLSAFLFLGPLVLSLLASGCTRQESRLSNRTAIEVNGRVVTTKEFADGLARQLRNRDALSAKDPQLLEKAKADLADLLILQIISEQWATEHKLAVTSEDLDRRISQVRAEYADELAFRKMLASENVSMDVWRDDLSKSLLRKRVFDDVTKGIPDPTDAEIRALYEVNKKDFQRAARIRLRQVVLEKEEDAKQVYEEFAKGRDLGALAKQFSIMPEAAENGDTGWVDKGLLEIFDQAFKLNVGAKSKIVKSPYGWHIYQVLAKEPERKLTMEQVKPSLIRELKERRAQAVFARWLEERIRSSTVKRDDAILKAISLSTRVE